MIPKTYVYQGLGQPRVKCRVAKTNTKGFHLNNMTSKRESLWLEGIIPLAMKIISDDVKSLEFLIADFDTRRIGIEILDGRDD